MSDSRPIGVFDSGLGGLTVFKEIIKLLPNEDLIYLGDTARIPYGTRSKATVTKFSFECVNFLLKRNVKCVVVACNTASAMAGRAIKRETNVPVFEVVTPALKEAKKISSGGKIGVIGTNGTIASGAYRVPFSKACPLLVPFIEEGELKNRALKIIIKKYMRPLKYRVDTLILGCTHYPIIENLIKKETGNKVKFVNPGKTVALSLKNFLIEYNLQNVKKKVGKREFFVTDLTAGFAKVSELFLGKSIKRTLKKVAVES